MARRASAVGHCITRTERTRGVVSELSTAAARFIHPSIIGTNIALNLVVGCVARLAEGSVEEESNTEKADCLVCVEAIDACLVVEEGVVAAGTAKGDCVGQLASGACCTCLQEIIEAQTSTIA